MTHFTDQYSLFYFAGIPCYNRQYVMVGFMSAAGRLVRPYQSVWYSVGAKIVRNCFAVSDICNTFALNYKTSNQYADSQPSLGVDT